MSKRCILLIIVLILLILLGLFRWQTVAEKSRDYYLFKWKTNIITGEQVLVDYMRDEIKTTRIGQGKDYSLLYIGALSITIPLTIYEILKGDRVQK